MCQHLQNNQSSAPDGPVFPMDTVTLTPVGIVRSEIKTPGLKAGQDGLSREGTDENTGDSRPEVREMVSELLINPELEGILDGIEEFSHILVLYWPHLVPGERRSLRKVHPMGRKDIPKQGIFATCSPARPNPILVTAVRLLERQGHTLRVEGFEAVDGSPILDIKPYNPGYYRIDQPKTPEWMDRILKSEAE